MNGDERTGMFDHLFTETVRDGLGGERYGSWRSIDAPGAVSLSYGFPFPASFPNDELVAAAEAFSRRKGNMRYSTAAASTQIDSSKPPPSESVSVATTARRGTSY